MEDDDEELHLYPWLDPKNKGICYTEAEAREHIGPIVNADDYIEQLKNEGIVLRSIEEQNEISHQLADNFKEKVTPGESDKYIYRYDYEVNKDDGLSRDEKLDLYYTQILDEDYDRRGTMLIDDMLANIDNLTDLMNGDLKEMEGKFAKANEHIMEYAVSNLKGAHTFITLSLEPAMKAVKSLCKVLKNRAIRKKELEKAQSTHDFLFSPYNIPPITKEEPFKTTQLGRGGKVDTITEWRTVNNVDHFFWEEKVKANNEDIKALEKVIEDLSRDAAYYLALVEKYEQENMNFTRYIDDLL